MGFSGVLSCISLTLAELYFLSVRRIRALCTGEYLAFIIQ
nr:MAG TPA: hypothetical protein [Caudoviricetes sp.]